MAANSRLLLVLLFQFFLYEFDSQTYLLSGKVSHKEEALPFATIIVKGTSISTNSNADGIYQLKLLPGKHEILFQYVGYEKRTETVMLNADRTLNVELRSDGVTLSEVDVTAGEDPAYPIMRQAIAKRRYYLEQVPAYSCKAYIKALQKINAMPKNIGSLIKLVGAELSDTNQLKGVVYLSESESEYFYRRPADVKEIMYSSKLSGDNRSFSFNKLSDMKLNFYKNLIEMGNLSNRPFVSPLNSNAFMFYRYFLLGHLESEGKQVFKIKVVPKNNTSACFRGVIYIQDSTWRLTGVDLMLPKETKINYVDTLLIKQIYAPVIGDSVWMPFSMNLSFTFRIFGFKGGGYFNAIISDYNLSPKYAENFFRNEVLVVQEGSNKKDSAYWSQHRAVPLTQEENDDYRLKDSLRLIRETSRYMDSVDHVTNRLKIQNLLLGYRYARTKKNFVLDIPGLINNGVHYNTVEGLNLSLNVLAQKTYEDFKQYNVKGRVRYGFSNLLWGGELGLIYLMDPKQLSSISFNVKSIVEQYNKQEPITPLINSLYTLFMNDNFMKLYKESGAEAEYGTEVRNGVFTGLALRYFLREDLQNRAEFIWLDNKSKLFTGNIPYTAADGLPAEKMSTALTAEIYVRLRFRQKYITQPYQKIITGSRYPRISLRYRLALPVETRSADYHLASATISDAIRLGIFGRFSFQANAGYFLRTGKMYFMDYHHFQGNQTLINTNSLLSSYRLLPYYTYSANKWFCELHAEQHFQGLLLGQIPLLKKIKAQEVMGAHFLSNNKLDYYYELNFGLERIFRVIRAEYVIGMMPKGKLRQGLSLSLNLRF